MAEPDSPRPAAAAAAAEPGAAQDAAASPRPSVLAHLKTTVLSSPLELAANLVRLAILAMCLLFMVSIGTPEGFALFYQILLLYMVVSAHRLYQRRGSSFRFSFDFFAGLMEEDSAHYLLYCLVFSNGQPMLLPLISLFIYAAFAVKEYFKKLLGPLSPKAALLLSKLDPLAPRAYKLASNAEVGLAFVLLFNVFTGRSLSDVVQLFMYSQFSVMHANSRRNRYPGEAWQRLRAVAESLIAHPSCPAVVGRVYRAVEAQIRRAVAAAQEAQQQQQQPRPHQD